MAKIELEVPDALYISIGASKHETMNSLLVKIKKRDIISPDVEFTELSKLSQADQAELESAKKIPESELISI